MTTKTTSDAFNIAFRIAAYFVMSVIALACADNFFGDTYCAAISLLTLGSFSLEVLWSSSHRKILLWSCIFFLAVFSVVLLSKVDSSSALGQSPAKFISKN